MFGEIVTRLAGMAERFCTALDCVDIGFIPDQTLDELPTASQIGATRVGGIDLNQARMRTALAAVLALAAAPHGFTITGFAEQVRVMTGQSTAGYRTRQASYDLRKIRGKHLIDKPGCGSPTGTSRAGAQRCRMLLGLVSIVGADGWWGIANRASGCGPDRLPTGDGVTDPRRSTGYRSDRPEQRDAGSSAGAQCLRARSRSTSFGSVVSKSFRRAQVGSIVMRAMESYIARTPPSKSSAPRALWVLRLASM